MSPKTILLSALHAWVLSLLLLRKLQYDRIFGKGVLKKVMRLSLRELLRENATYVCVCFSRISAAFGSWLCDENRLNISPKNSEMIEKHKLIKRPQRYIQL